MALLSKRKNKKYNYKPRYYQGEGNPFEIKPKFDEFRVTVGSDNGLKNKFIKAVNDFKTNQNKEANTRVMVIVVILLLLFLFIIDFDLSIFRMK